MPRTILFCVSSLSLWQISSPRRPFYPHTPLSTMNRIISLLLIIVALAASSVQGFAPSSLGGISGGEFFLVYVVVPKMR